jgi:hypothetical protein
VKRRLRAMKCRACGTHERPKAAGRVKFMALFVIICGFVTSCGSRGVPTEKSASSSTGARVTRRPVRAPENDDSIASYGRDATGQEREATAGLVTNYYAAVVTHDGTKACSLLLGSLAHAVPEDYGKPPGPPALRGKTCKSVLTKLATNVPGQSLRALRSTKVTGVRLKGANGFVQLRSSAMPTGEIFVERESGHWKVASLIGRPCSNCAAH